MKKIAYFRNPSRGVNYHRLAVPLRRLSSEYDVTEVDLIPLKTDHYDVFIFNRSTPNVFPYSAVVELKKQGMKFIYDLDDYWTRPEYNMNYRQGLEDIYTIDILKYLRLADVVWTSTKKLQELIAPINPNVVLVPNCLDYSEDMWIRQEVQRELTFGWVGGISHHKDFETIIDFHRQPYKAKGVLCGVEKVDEYWKYLGNIITGGDYKSVKFVKDMEAHEYGYLYNEIDIKILPSAKDLFTECKSNLKLLEAGAHKLPVITNSGIYRKELNGRGVIAENPTTWRKALNRLIESKAMRQDYGEALHEYTKTNYDLDKANQIRKQTI